MFSTFTRVVTFTILLCHFINPSLLEIHKQWYRLSNYYRLKLLVERFKNF